MVSLWGQASTYLTAMICMALSSSSLRRAFTISNCWSKMSWILMHFFWASNWPFEIVALISAFASCDLFTLAFCGTSHQSPTLYLLSLLNLAYPKRIDEFCVPQRAIIRGPQWAKAESKAAILHLKKWTSVFCKVFQKINKHSFCREMNAGGAGIFC